MFTDIETGSVNLNRDSFDRYGFSENIKIKRDTILGWLRCTEYRSGHDVIKQYTITAQTGLCAVVDEFDALLSKKRLFS